MENLFNIIGFIFLFLSLAVSGVLGSGDRIRANYSKDTSEDRRSRLRLSGIFLLISLISFGLQYI